MNDQIQFDQPNFYSHAFQGGKLELNRSLSGKDVWSIAVALDSAQGDTVATAHNISFEKAQSLAAAFVSAYDTRGGVR
jgi:hypothetical protein